MSRDGAPPDDLLAGAAGDELAGDTQDAVTAWVQQTVKPERPPAALRQRLLRTLEGADRYRPFFGAIQNIFDIPEALLRGILARIEEASGWSLYGDARYFHFEPGPRLAGQEAGVVRMAPGVVFPRHLHRGGELTFVLDGLMSDRDRLYGPGSVVEAEPGTTHDYRAAGVGRDLILLSRHGGIEFVP